MQKLNAGTVSAVGALFSDLTARTNMPGDELEEAVRDALRDAAVARNAPMQGQVLQQRGTLLLGQEIEQHGLQEVVSILRRHFALPDLAPDVPKTPDIADQSLRRYAGVLLEHGKANYHFDPQEKPSYWVKIQTAEGRESTLWGVDLERAVKEGHVAEGEDIHVDFLGNRPVIVTANKRDETGKVIGVEEIESRRNTWRVSKAVTREADVENAIRPVAAVEEVPAVESTGENAIRPATVVPPVKRQDEAETTRDDEQEGVIKQVRPANDVSPTAEKANYESPAKLLNNRFVLGENGEYRRVGETRVALVDEVEQIRFVDKQMDTFQAGIELAKLKEWQAIEVTGTEKFRGEAWFHARMAGLEVVGYEPQEKDLERLQAAQKRLEHDGKMAEKPSEAMQKSRKEAENFVLDSGAGLQVANESKGRYAGPVVHETDHHFVQDIGRGVAVLHEKSRFAEMEVAKAARGQGSAKIQYQEGKGAIEAGRDRNQGLSR